MLSKQGHNKRLRRVLNKPRDTEPVQETNRDLKVNKSSAENSSSLRRYARELVSS